MAIGDVSASGGISRQVISDNSGNVRAQAASGLSGAINDFANAFAGERMSALDLQNYYDNRAMASKGLEAETGFLELQRQNAELYTQMSRERSASPLGLTEDYDKAVVANNEKFISTLDPRLQDEYRNKAEQDRSNRRLSAFQSELTFLDAKDKTTLESNLNTLGSAIKARGASLEDAQQQWADFVNKSMLPSADKEALIQSGNNTLATLQFGNEVTDAAAGRGDRTDIAADGSDVVAAGLSPQQRGVLNCISSEEARSYDVMNGGERFTDFSDHPRRVGAGGTSTAAGRYQFTASTWDIAKASYERTYGVPVPDFSPGWQDRVALHWAEKRFNELNGEGLTFAGVLAGGDPTQILKIKSVLGLPRGGDPNAVEWQGLGTMSDQKFLEIFTGQRGLAGGGTPAAIGPNVWTDPRFAGIGLDQKQSLANSAASSMSSAATQAAADANRAAELFRKQMFELGYQYGNLNQLSELKKNQMFNAEAERRFREGVDGYNKKEASVSEVTQKLSSKSALLPRDQAGFTNWFGQDSFNGLANGDQAAYDKLRYAVSQSGQMPNGTVEAMRLALASPQSERMAMEFLASLNAGDPRVLAKAGFTDKDLADSLLFGRIASRTDPQTAYAQFGQIKDQRKTILADPAKAKKDAETYFAENVTPQDLANLHRGLITWAPNDPVAPVNPATSAQLMADASSAFTDGYMITGSTEGAEAYMEAYIKKTWGPTTVGSQKELMKYAPENYYDAVNGDHSYLQRELQWQLSPVNAPSGQTLREDSGMIVADTQTESEVRAGKLPTYRIMATNDQGQIVMLPQRFGGADMRPDVATDVEKETNRIVLTTRVDAAVQLLRDKKNEITELNRAEMTPENKALLEKKQAEAEALLTEVKKRKASAEEAGVLKDLWDWGTSDPLDDSTRRQSDGQ